MEIYEDQIAEFLRTVFLAILIIAGAVCMFFGMNAGIAHAAEAYQPKVEAIYFWGQECPHCAHLKPWLDDFENQHKDTLRVKRYEFWHNEVNAQFFTDTMKAYGVPDNQMGAPAIVVNNKVLIGTKDIQENFEREYNAALEKVQKKAKNEESLAETLARYTKDNQKNASSEGLLTGGDDLGSKATSAAETKDIGAITATALADSVNPCAMAVLVILLSSLIVMQKSKAKIAATAFSFVAASYVTYFLVGLGLTQAFSIAGVSDKIIIAVGAISIFIGLAELKDAFFYRKGSWAVEIPFRWRDKLSKLILSVTSPAGAFTVGAIVTMFELPCTGGPYLFGLSIISQHSALMRILLLAYYNLIFVAPLVLISLIIVLSKKATERVNAIEHFRNTHTKAMHFIVGIMMLALGVWALAFR